jgi:flavin reductase (DIM6/NTAB) family NADH-FMN oxidoreductase RutF
MSASPDTCGKIEFHKGRDILKRLVLGPSVFPHQCTVGLRAPQSEISAWLDTGTGTLRDVTSSNLIAGTQPLVIGIGTDSGEVQSVVDAKRPVLRFREQNANQRTLGKISLEQIDTLSVGTAQLHLFRALGSANYCLPKARQWARYFYHGCQRWRSGTRSTVSGLRISQRELRCLYAFYICPRPVALVSVMDRGAGNIFPMDLSGSFADDHFALALHADSGPAPLLESSRKIALSDIPMEQVQLAYALGKNHNRKSVDCGRMAFATIPSPSYQLPVPEFSVRVREMQIESVRNMGSHKLFLARVIADHRSSNGLQPHFIHGFYQTWRQQFHAPQG